MKHISKYTNNYLNGVIVNDGWDAYLKGQPMSSCPYPDDPTAAERWKHGYKEAETYMKWKTGVVNKWEKQEE